MLKISMRHDQSGTSRIAFSQVGNALKSMTYRNLKIVGVGVVQKVQRRVEETRPFPSWESLKIKDLQKSEISKDRIGQWARLRRLPSSSLSS